MVRTREDGLVAVVIAFDPADPSRHDTTAWMPASEARSLIASGRARWPEGDELATPTQP